MSGRRVAQGSGGGHRSKSRGSRRAQSSLLTSMGVSVQPAGRVATVSAVAALLVVSTVLVSPETQGDQARANAPLSSGPVPAQAGTSASSAPVVPLKPGTLKSGTQVPEASRPRAKTVTAVGSGTGVSDGTSSTENGEVSSGTAASPDELPPASTQPQSSGTTQPSAIGEQGSGSPVGMPSTGGAPGTGEPQPPTQSQPPVLPPVTGGTGSGSQPGTGTPPVVQPPVVKPPVTQPGTGTPKPPATTPDPTPVTPPKSCTINVLGICISILR
ncbi:hypothetical protein [Arthrobacter sp. NPDC090010]|uniref:hypothetical protein n=1 Tax=Arthrobacter sp. NPDC090010 TaxID=3363942 RepID=UPI0038044B3A